MKNELRGLFPLLSGSLAYLDSAAKSLTPSPVIEAMNRYYRECDASAGRSIHSLSIEALRRTEEARERVAALVGGRAEEIVFAGNATEALNTVASGTRWNLGDRVVTTIVEHHSNYLPWVRLAQQGIIELVVVGATPEGEIRLDELLAAVQGGRTRLVAATMVSNALGTIQPVREICEIARRAGALSLIDAAQAVPHLPVDVRQLGCDYLVWSGHKMFGPAGTGALWAKRGLLPALHPPRVGGGPVEDVHRRSFFLRRNPPYAFLESGTPNTPGIIGFGEAARLLPGWRKEYGDAVRDLAHQAAGRLAGIPGVVVTGPPERGRRAGVVSFWIDGVSPHQAAAELDARYQVLVRSGHHCALPLMKEVLKHPAGTVRASFHLYSNQPDVDRLVEAVASIARERKVA